jgi:hypothetical protein
MLAHNNLTGHHYVQIFCFVPVPDGEGARRHGDFANVDAWAKMVSDWAGSLRQIQHRSFDLLDAFMLCDCCGFD